MASSSSCCWCWWCCHPFPHDPVGMPVRYDAAKKTFATHGNFCSYECVKAHVMYDKTSSSRQSKLLGLLQSYLLHLYKGKKHGGVYAGVHPAPPRQCLRVFGGTMDIDEFRAVDGSRVAYELVPPAVTGTVMHMPARVDARDIVNGGPVVPIDQHAIRRVVATHAQQPPAVNGRGRGPVAVRGGGVAVRGGGAASRGGARRGGASTTARRPRATLVQFLESGGAVNSAEQVGA